MRHDPYDDLAAAACACCRAQIRLRHLRAPTGAGTRARPAQLRSAEQAAARARDVHLRLRRDLLGC